MKYNSSNAQLHLATRGLCIETSLLLSFQFWQLSNGKTFLTSPVTTVLWGIRDNLLMGKSIIHKVCTHPYCILHVSTNSNPSCSKWNTYIVHHSMDMIYLQWKYNWMPDTPSYSSSNVVWQFSYSICLLLRNWTQVVHYSTL